ncbi:helix-turn-helix domain-containing protein [Dyella sp. C9]|uniref:AraC family transcriptional regulator n=1 Tax=Dyella sp. C9 TaxID=2202154 RepID=UPI000DEF945A|nr:helix-turn-helix transcriptional regulator [Dyella sp. C9]
MDIKRTVDDCEACDRPVAALATDYVHGDEVPTHSHHRAQLIHGVTGAMTVTSDGGRWVVPTGKAVWMPAGMSHRIRMAGDVRMRTVYVRTDARPGLPQRCEVIDVSPLLREAIMAAMAIPLDYRQSGRDHRVMQLILDELEQAPRLSMHVPFPQDARLMKVCRQLMADPARAPTLDELAGRIHVSGRTLSRLFERELGMSVSAWRRRMCLVLSLPQLASGASLADVALAFGYDSPSAFTAMFKRELGMAPTMYLAHQS